MLHTRKVNPSGGVIQTETRSAHCNLSSTAFNFMVARCPKRVNNGRKRRLRFTAGFGGKAVVITQKADMRKGPSDLCPQNESQRVAGYFELLGCPARLSAHLRPLFDSSRGFLCTTAVTATRQLSRLPWTPNDRAVSPMLNSPRGDVIPESFGHIA